MSAIAIHGQTINVLVSLHASGTESFHLWRSGCAYGNQRSQIVRLPVRSTPELELRGGGSDSPILQCVRGSARIRLSPWLPGPERDPNHDLAESPR